MNDYVVRSPHGLIHIVKRRDGTGYWRTLCGRLAEPGWSQRAWRLTDQESPFVCRMCRTIRLEVMSKQTGT